MAAQRMTISGEAAWVAGMERLLYANPFAQERIEIERALLGKDFVETGAAWNLDLELPRRLPNVEALFVRTEERLRAYQSRRRRPPAGHLEPLVLFLLFHAHTAAFDDLLTTPGEATHRERKARRLFYGFRNSATAWKGTGVEVIENTDTLAATFAVFFQLRRAFYHISRSLAGRSPAMAALRASIWESVFTSNMRRYRRALIGRMSDVPTLITGPTGTGKELVARAIGLSRYIPFDAARGAFVEDFQAGFFPLNLSALSPTLIESELFGHRKGAFTGAYADRTGWLEACPPHGAVFLDEIGELEPALQVKLLRVLQDRTFQRIGEQEPRIFSGKLIAATNRSLAEEVAAGRFRSDFYFRLCADQIRTPSLAEQIEGNREELAHLVRVLARRVVGEAEAPAFATEALAVINKSPGPAYPWPGNFRELEQCLRSILVRGRYTPLAPPAGEASGGDLDRSLEAVVQAHCQAVFAACGTYEETARRLGVDRRTVRRHVHGP